MKSIVLVTADDDDESYEALYVDGRLKNSDDSGIYACHLCYGAQGEPCTLTHLRLELPAGEIWPETLAELDRYHSETLSPEAKRRPLNGMSEGEANERMRELVRCLLAHEPAETAAMLLIFSAETFYFGTNVDPADAPPLFREMASRIEAKLLAAAGGGAH